MHSHYLKHLREIAEGSRHALAKEQNLCCLLAPAFCKQPFYTTVSPCSHPE